MTFGDRFETLRTIRCFGGEFSERKFHGSDSASVVVFPGKHAAK
jgi:hypothetical protein